MSDTGELLFSDEFEQAIQDVAHMSTQVQCAVVKKQFNRYVGNKRAAMWYRTEFSNHPTALVVAVPELDGRRLSVHWEDDVLEDVTWFVCNGARHQSLVDALRAGWTLAMMGEAGDGSG